MSEQPNQTPKGSNRIADQGDGLPADVREYLLAGCGLGQAVAQQNNPGVKARLKSHEVQAALYRYLASPELWHEQNPALGMAALDFLMAFPSLEQEKTVRALTLHPNAGLRLRAYRYLLTFVYPNDRPGITKIVESLLADKDETLRREGSMLAKNLKLQK